MTVATPPSVSTRPEAELQVFTEPLKPLRFRYAEARNRIIATFGPRVGATVAAANFDRSVSDLSRLGLDSPGLLVAAEHMATTRLRVLNDDNSELGFHD